MPESFDLVIVGSGPAGGACGRTCAEAGLKVAVVEDRTYGGVCPNRGCNPKKILVDCASAVHRARVLKGKGTAGDVHIDWPALQAFKRGFTDGMSDRIGQSLATAGLTTIFGRARLAGPNTVEAAERELQAKHIMLAPGAYPRPLDIPGEELLTHSDEFLELEQLPERVVFLGGGFISFEFAHVAAIAGARATILHRGETPLKRFDPDLVEQLLDASAERGVDVRTQVAVQAIRRGASGLVVETADGEFEADMVVHGAGRVPDLRGLNLEAANVEATTRGVVVNEFMQSVSNPAVYAGGDAAATPFALTPTGDLEGKVAARNILDGNTLSMDRGGVPSAVFTIPPLASVGLTEAEAGKRGIRCEIRYHETGNSFTSRKIGQRHAGFKLLLDEAGERILGAHILGHNAEEMINVFALAIRLNLSVDELRKVLWVYPTTMYDIKHMLG